MKLNDLISTLDTPRITGPVDLEISGIAYDSRKVKKGNLFVAIPGFRVDGAKFIPEAVRRGAQAVVLEKDNQAGNSISKILVPHSRTALARLAHKFYDYPSKKLKIAGITGTNGKTTTSYFLESIFRTAGRKTGLIGTLGTKINGKFIQTTLTTPESLELLRILHDMAGQRVENVVMEVSSHALTLNRVEGIEFDAAVHTNFTHDHLDFHKTMEKYLEAKLLLFKSLGRAGKAASAIINADDDYAGEVKKECLGPVLTYAVNNPAQIKAREIATKFPEMRINIVTPKGELEVLTPFLGVYNAYNILAAVSTALAFDFEIREIKKGIESLTNIPGRLEKINCGQNFLVIVDFAHTPDGLKKLLETFRPHARKRLILVFGCPGSRDKLKRPLMGEIAAGLADFSILTSDDPHDEDPAEIIREVEKGMKTGRGKYRMIEDRKDAIKKSLEMAQKDDLVLIVGRGHETIQEVAGSQLPLDDREIVRKILSKARNSAC